MRIFLVQQSDSDVQWIDLEARKEMDLKTECISVIPDRIQEKDNSNFKSPFKGAFLLPSYKPYRMTFPIIFGILAVIIIIIRRHYRARNNGEK